MLSEKIKKYRLDNNLTQQDLASKLFVTRNTISKWENDNGYPSLDTLKDLAKLMNTTIDELLSENDYKTIAITSNEKLSKYKQYLLNLFVFLSYAAIAILIPHLMFTFDPTSPLAYGLIIGPISFIVLGLITPLYNKNMLHSLICAALAITPTLIYFEVATNVSIYFSEIIYYLLFILSYCIMLKILKVNLKNNGYKIAKWISLSMLIFLSLTYLILAISSLITDNKDYSFSFYTVVFFAPIMFFVILYIIFKRKCNKD